MAKLTHCFGTNHTSKCGILWFQRDHKLKMALTMRPIFSSSKQVFAVGDVTMVCPSLFTVNDSDFWVDLSYMSRSAKGFFPLGSLSLALSLLP